MSRSLLLVADPQHPQIHLLRQVLRIDLGLDTSPEERLQGACVLRK